MKARQSTPAPSGLAAAWQARWNDALRLWSRYVQLSDPQFCVDVEQEKHAGLTGSFAMIRLDDHAVVISLRQVADYHLQDFPLEIMGHEIGHHVYCPGDLLDHGRMLARMRRSLPGKTHLAGFVGNLYTDLFINDRLQRTHGLRMHAVYEALRAHHARSAPQSNPDPLWNFYMRVYEILWSLPQNTLTAGEIPATMEGDARLGARLIRNYARNWLGGAGRFAALCLTYLMENEGAQSQKMLGALMDSIAPGAGADCPAGLTEIEEDEITGAIHPSLDPEERAPAAGVSTEAAPGATGRGQAGQHREPHEYGQILEQLGIKLQPAHVAMRYYRERATPHLVPFPQKERPRSQDPLPEGFDTWDLGSPIENIDWVATATRSPIIIPGYTTLEQVIGVSEGNDPKQEPIDLDLYVDCSGSMPDPRINTSYLTLAGAIIALSALRVGARVQATLWSGRNEIKKTEGFVSDSDAILDVLTGYFGGGTDFPLGVFQQTYGQRKAGDRKVHILVISDEGVNTMFPENEATPGGPPAPRGTTARLALEKADGGGTFVLNLYNDWQSNADLKFAHEMGWEIFRVQTWQDLEVFARAFSRKKYGRAP